MTRGRAACFHALTLVARRAHADVPARRRPHGSGSAHARAAGGHGLIAHLRVEIPGLPPKESRALVDRADLVCPYSNAVRGNITGTHEIVTGAPGTN